MTISRVSDRLCATLVASLQRQVKRIEGLRPLEDDWPISTGAPPLDRLLPSGGLRRGSLVEYLSPGSGSGTGTLALAAARQACAQGGPPLRGRIGATTDSTTGAAIEVSLNQPFARALVIIDRSRTFYPPAAAAWGIDLSQTLILQPANDEAKLWALDQALRCRGVGAVYATCGALDVRDFRRLQLAAESGDTLGVLVRPARLRGQPSWADVQWEVSRVHERSEMHQRAGRKVHFAPLMHPTPWRLRIELVRCRGGPGGQTAELELDERTGIWQDARTSHATNSMPLSAQLADPARPRRA